MTAAPPDDAVARRPAAGRGPRLRLTAVCAALLLAAAGLEGAARLSWFSAGVDAVGRGTVVVTATGADLVPALTGVALLAVAAVAATVALAGPARRLLGALLALVGAGVGVAVVRLLLSPPSPSDLAALPGAPAGGTPAPGPAVLHPGPLPAVVAVGLLLAAGVVLATAERRLPRFGARYAARPATRSTGRPAPARAAAAPVDPDRAAWDALDAGRDPTVGPSIDGPSTGDRAGAGERTDGGRADRAD